MRNSQAAEVTALRSVTAIVIVGNGPSLLGRGLGPRIDEFEEIVRFNGYQLANHERDVGTRTTIWSRTYCLPDNRYMDSLSSIWINMPFHERTDSKVKTAFELVAGYDANSSIIPRTEVALSLQQSTYGLNDTRHWPSSGLLAIAHALDAGYTEVFVAGIDAWNKEPFHYYEVHDRTGSHHLASVEQPYLRDLVSKGSIRVL